MTSIVRGEMLKNADLALGCIEVNDDPLGDPEIAAAQQAAGRAVRDFRRILYEKIQNLTLCGWRYNGLFYCIQHRPLGAALPIYDTEHDHRSCFSCAHSLLFARQQLSS